MVRDAQRYDKVTTIADAVGITHLIVANLVILLGEVTRLFGTPSRGVWPGVDIIFQYIDTPVYLLFRSFGLELSTQGDWVQVLMVAQFVIIASSILYGVIAFFFLKVFLAIIDI